LDLIVYLTTAFKLLESISVDGVGTHRQGQQLWHQKAGLQTVLLGMVGLSIYLISKSWHFSLMKLLVPE
jgi:hypothetical protein